MSDIKIAKQIEIEKLTINICVGNDKLGMVRAEKLITSICKDRKPTKCCAKKRLATWKLRPGLPIGYKLTLRKAKAIEFLTWILDSKGKKIKQSSFDKYGNFGVGIAEYLDLKGMKYDADIGIMGFEIMVSFKRKYGNRVKSRLLREAKIPNRHKPSKTEVFEFLKNTIEGVKIE